MATSSFNIGDLNGDITELNSKITFKNIYVNATTLSESAANFDFIILRLRPNNANQTIFRIAQNGYGLLEELKESDSVYSRAQITISGTSVTATDKGHSAWNVLEMAGAFGVKVNS